MSRARISHEGTDYERRRERAARAARRATSPRPAHLLASATAFFFLAFVFAYFYLRSLNNDGLWQPKHVDPSLTLGTLVDRRVRARGALVLWLGVARPPGRPPTGSGGSRARSRSRSASRRVVLQVVEWTTIGLRPGRRRLRERLLRLDGVLRPLRASARCSGSRRPLATSIRYRERPTSTRRRPARPPATRTGSAHDIRDPLSLVRAEPRGGVVLLGLPRRARRPRLDRPLPRSEGAAPVPLMTSAARLAGAGRRSSSCLRLRLPVLARRDGSRPGHGARGRSARLCARLRSTAGLADDRDRARHAARLAGRLALRRAHDPARAAADGRAAADRALGALDAAVAAAAARLSADGGQERSRAAGGRPRCALSAGSLARPAARLDRVQRGPRRLARARALRRDAVQRGGSRPRARHVPRRRRAVLAAGVRLAAGPRAPRVRRRARST